MMRHVSALSALGMAAWLAACGGASDSSFTGGSGNAEGGGSATSATGGQGGDGGASGTGGSTTAAGQGGAGTGPGAQTSSSTGAGEGCMAITVAEPVWIQTSVYTAQIDQNVDGEARDQLSLKFFETDFDGQPLDLAGDEPGTYDLANEPSYFDCAHCFMAHVNPDETGLSTKDFYQESGTFTLEAERNDVLEGGAVYALTDVVFREAIVDFGTGATAFVPGGACLYLASARYDHPAYQGAQ